MIGFSNCTICGNLTRIPELRYSTSGTPIADFDVAINQPNDETTFVRCTAFGKLAENVSAYLDRGSRVLVSGSLRTERWENSEGTKRSRLKVVAFSVIFLDRKKSNSTDTGGSNNVSGLDDDIPF